MPDAIDWSHAVTEVPATGPLRMARSATDAERLALTADLGVLKISALNIDYSVSPGAGGVYRLKGRVSAEIEQSCIVSLEPVIQRMDEPFDVEFWPGGQAAIVEEGELTVLDAPEHEPIEHGRIAVGRIVRETVSAALDPYPRAAGSEFDWEDKSLPGKSLAGPFAKLGELKRDTD